MSLVELNCVDFWFLSDDKMLNCESTAHFF